MQVEKMTYSRSKVAEANRRAKALRFTARRKGEYLGWVYWEIKDVYMYCQQNVNWAMFHKDFAGGIVQLRELVNNPKVTVEELKAGTRYAINYLRRELASIEKLMDAGEVNVTE